MLKYNILSVFAFISFSSLSAMNVDLSKALHESAKNLSGPQLSKKLSVKIVPAEVKKQLGAIAYAAIMGNASAAVGYRHGHGLWIINEKNKYEAFKDISDKEFYTMGIEQQKLIPQLMPLKPKQVFNATIDQHNAIVNIPAIIKNKLQAEVKVPVDGWTKIKRITQKIAPLMITSDVIGGLAGSYLKALDNNHEVTQANKILSKSVYDTTYQTTVKEKYLQLYEAIVLQKIVEDGCLQNAVANFIMQDAVESISGEKSTESQFNRVFGEEARKNWNFFSAFSTAAGIICKRKHSGEAQQEATAQVTVMAQQAALSAVESLSLPVADQLFTAVGMKDGLLWGTLYALITGTAQSVLQGDFTRPIVPQKAIKDITKKI